jgi:predicted DNA-binding protein (MmcQ/YjbR family)
MAASSLARVRKLMRALPDVEEKISWGEPTWRTRKMFAMYASGNTHHGQGKDAIWLLSSPTNQEFVLRAQPKHYFKPPYVGPSGWIGAYLDSRTRWKELASLIEDAHATSLRAKPRKQR